MTFKDIQVERDGSTAVVTLNRPERRNALSLQMLQELKLWTIHFWIRQLHSTSTATSLFPQTILSPYTLPTRS